MRRLFGVALSLLMVTAAAQSPNNDDAVRHAAATVAHIHDRMNDPASFLLDGAYVTKPNQHGAVSYCYEFRGRNRQGEYSEGRAVEDAKDHLHLSICRRTATGVWLGYDTGLGAPCKKKNIDRDITLPVSDLAPALYKESK